MSSTASPLAVPAALDRRLGRETQSAPVALERPLIRLLAFAGLALYGVLRWSALMSPAPTWRMLGLFSVALALVAGGPWLGAHGRGLAILAAAVAVFLGFALCGVPMRWIVHLRVAHTADAIGNGLSALPRVLVPYTGSNHWVEVAMLLGAAVLLLDAGLLLAFAPPMLGDLRRAGAALPLVALAVVPLTLMRPQLPYLQGLILFILLGLFMWGERVRRDDVVMVVVACATAAAAAMVLAPGLDSHRPWIDYQAIAGSLDSGRTEAFDWSQRYGPLNWPRTGHTVLSVQAERPDYWKAENLDVFDGRGWVPGSASADPLDGVDANSIRTWTQTLEVTIGAMKTSQVIGAGTARYPDRVSGTVAPGSSPGTWVAPGELGPGDTYSVTVYSPHPSAAQLKVAGTHYPAELLPWYLSLQIPVGHQAARPLPVNFPPFHRRTAEIGGIEASTAEDTALLKQSPYAPAFALARRLATQSRTPYDYATRIEAYLGNGYVYDEKPPVRLYPLESFLFDDKLGYCQQFAGTMALLLRMGGVPARVATGFATGVYDAKAHRWTATDVDAHSWVEAWFPHYGWVRFDPTPYAAPARGGQAPSSAASALSFDTSQTAAGQGHRDAPVPSPKKASAGKSGGASSTIVLGALGGVALLVILGLLVAGTRAQPDPERLLAELERALARSGRPLSPNVTLAALEQRFRHAPEAAAYVKALRLARYGGAGELPSARQRRAVRAQLRAGLGLTGLLRSLWALPPRRTARTASDGHTRGINSE